MLIRLIVPGEHARVEDLNTSLEAVLKRHGIDAGVRGDVRLIVEELASNAIAYGGVDGIDIGQHELSVDIAIAGDLLTLEFRDEGAPFDPLSIAPPDLEADIMDRPIGGLGLYLIRQIAEETHYRRVDDANLLRVSLRIATPETLP
ncbi:MAG: ATP-binding protein [Pseudoxanthomonas sp.]